MISQEKSHILMKKILDDLKASRVENQNLKQSLKSIKENSCHKDHNIHIHTGNPHNNYGHNDTYCGQNHPGCFSYGRASQGIITKVVTRNDLSCD